MAVVRYTRSGLLSQAVAVLGDAAFHRIFDGDDPLPILLDAAVIHLVAHRRLGDITPEMQEALHDLHVTGAFRFASDQDG